MLLLDVLVILSVIGEILLLQWLPDALRLVKLVLLGFAAFLLQDTGILFILLMVVLRVLVLILIVAFGKTPELLSAVLLTFVLNIVVTSSMSLSGISIMGTTAMLLVAVESLLRCWCENAGAGAVWRWLV